MFATEIHIKDDQYRFYTGDLVSGSAEIELLDAVPIANAKLSFTCVGEVKWMERPNNHRLTNFYDGNVYYDQNVYHEEVLHTLESVIPLVPYVDRKKIYIPFEFTIPKDLPSTMDGNCGCVKYNINLLVNKGESNEGKLVKEISVFSPMDKNLMVKVGGTAEKTVLLHGGKITMHASIGRKGFAAGEVITVHVTVDNKTNTSVVPRISLRKVEIFMCGIRHRTEESQITEDPVIGVDVVPNLKIEEILDLKIPSNLSLSIKSSMITVKYFVHVTLIIPHSFDLHVDLPVVITASKVIDELMCNRNESNLEQTMVKSL